MSAHVDMIMGWTSILQCWSKVNNFKLICNNRSSADFSNERVKMMRVDVSEKLITKKINIIEVKKRLQHFRNYANLASSQNFKSTYFRDQLL